MAIIVSQNGKNASLIDQSNFELEADLQQYVYDNPDIIPLYQIEEDIRLFVASREFRTKSGPIDAVGFDIRGNIYVVETKLYKNPDKRTVVAQALDYGASLWRHSIDFSAFIAQLEDYSKSFSGKTFKERYEEFFEIQDATENLESIKANLAEGSIKFVVLMDSLHDALKDLVVFVNQNSKFDLYAVELEYYKHREFEIIIPKLFGAEVKKDLNPETSNSSWTTINEQEFMAELLTTCDNSQFFKKQFAYKVHELHKLIDEKTNTGYIDYSRTSAGNKLAKSLLYDGNSYNIVLRSDGVLELYPFQKQIEAARVARRLMELLGENEILGMDQDKAKRAKIYIKLLEAKSEDELRQFINCYQQAISDIYQSLPSL